MTITAVKTIRGLERGLAVFRLLQQQGAMSLNDLHQKTKLPRASLSRILLTLNRAGFIAQRIADNYWIIADTGIEQAGASRKAGRLARAASPILDELCMNIIWPSDLSIRVGTHMELVETSRAHSSLMLRRIRVGFPINMLLSAPGRAYLAFTSEKERNSIINRIRRKPGLGHEVAVSEGVIEHIIQSTRYQGYGARDDGWGGHISDPISRYDDGLNAIAVPIMQKECVLGCVNIVWIRNLISQSEMAKRHLAQLQEAARNISNAYLS